MITDIVPQERIFLVVVDGSDELRAALHYACLRARHTMAGSRCFM